MQASTALALALVAACLAVATAHAPSHSSPPPPPPSPTTIAPLNDAGTTYYSDGHLVAYYVYRVHNQVLPLENDNAASPGGEVGFLANEFSFTDGVITRDCVVMYNQTFSPYDCCNGGSCSNCDYDGSADGPQNMPGRSFQLYPPPGAPCTQQAGDCSGLPGVECAGECSGWWYSFGAGMCSAGQTPTANGCTWYSSPVLEVVEFATLLNGGNFYSCEQTAQNPNGGCDGNLEWQPFMTSVSSLLNLFSKSARTMVLDSSNTFVNATVPAYANPASMCQAPCPPGSYSATGYMTSKSQCQWCAKGTYNPYQAATSCQKCSGGGSSAVGATSSSQCSAGSFSPPSNQDGDADADADGDSDAFLAQTTSTTVKLSGSSLPSYSVVLIVLACVIFVVAFALVVVRAIRARRLRNSPIMMVDLEGRP